MNKTHHAADDPLLFAEMRRILENLVANSLQIVAKSPMTAMLSIDSGLALPKEMNAIGSYIQMTQAAYGAIAKMAGITPFTYDRCELDRENCGRFFFEVSPEIDIEMLRKKFIATANKCLEEGPETLDFALEAFRLYLGKQEVPKAEDNGHGLSEQVIKSKLKQQR